MFKMSSLYVNANRSDSRTRSKTRGLSAMSLAASTILPTRSIHLWLHLGLRMRRPLITWFTFIAAKKCTILNFKILENYDFLNFYLFLKKSFFWVFIPTVEVCTVSIRRLYKRICIYMGPSRIYSDQIHVINEQNFPGNIAFLF